ncbi:hypothetical protein JL193_06715 [Polaribacter batillariae]|uniref:DUF6398 domain-containing protein n=1 Tax=Polaribacter batillariae TaxID=2808900 RepID=A0ABX7T085_9FLAO|nr:DUF6398 domain-containing protein [Polaribacter batillariae]QTD38940.1 hypothetical protein JL193_06715 [Polaribacter batillariae]
MTKAQIKEREKQLLELTGAFCIQKINQEYLELCEKLIKKMARKREVPFKRGKLEIWASAVIYAIGSINFLFDKSFEPYVSSKQICEYFNTKQTTVSSKARIIKEMFDLWHFSPEFSTQSMEKTNPFNNVVFVDDLIVPLDSLSEEMQQMVLDARAKGDDISFTTIK